MLPFSKRPPPPESYFLQSGDFEAVEEPTMPPRAPLAGRAAVRPPVFHQSAPAFVTPPPARSRRSSALSEGARSTADHSERVARADRALPRGSQALRPSAAHSSRVAPRRVAQPASQSYGHAPAETFEPAYAPAPAYASSPAPAQANVYAYEPAYAPAPVAYSAATYPSDAAYSASAYPYQTAYSAPYAYPEAAYAPAPAPAHSLSPVAMSAEYGPLDTGNYPQQTTGSVVVRTRPTLTLGLTIAVAGALIGGMLGIGMDLRRDAGNEARAAAAMQMSAVAPASPDANSLVPVLMPAAAVPQAVAAPVVVAPAPSVVAGSVVANTTAQAAPGGRPSPAAKTVARPEAPVVMARQPSIVVTPPAKAPAVAHKAPAPAAKPVQTPSVASKGPAQKASSDDALADKPEKPAKGRTKEADDALRMFSAANAETSLTLGGSK